MPLIPIVVSLFGRAVAGRRESRRFAFAADDGSPAGAGSRLALVLSGRRMKGKSSLLCHCRA